MATGRAGPVLGPAVRLESARRWTAQKSTCTLTRTNRGSRTAVGCIHRAPLVAGSYTVSYVVGVLALNRLYRSTPTFVLDLPNRRTLAKRISTTLVRSPYSV